MAYGNFKDLHRRTTSDKVFRDKALNIAKNPKYDGYQRGLASLVYNFFDKKSSVDNTSGDANTYIDFGEENNDYDPKFKVGGHVRISKYKKIKVTPQIGLKKLFWLKKLKILCRRTDYEEELQKTNQKDFKVEKKSRERVMNYMPNGKTMIIGLIVGLIKKDIFI